MVITQALEFPGPGFRSLPCYLLALCPVIRDPLSPGLSVFICKNHEIVGRIVDCALCRAWTHGKGSVAWKRRKLERLNLWCQSLDSLRQWADTPMRQSNDLTDEWDAKWKFTWGTWPLCLPLPVLQHMRCEHAGVFSLQLQLFIRRICAQWHV